MATAVDDNEPGRHYSLHAYVLPGGVIRLTPFGRVTFSHIYQNRPVEARYAIAGYYNTECRAHEFLTWDLFIVQAQMPKWDLVTPPPRIKHADLDAAILATILLYNDRGL